MTRIKKILDSLDPEKLFEMSNVDREDSNVPYRLWFSVKPKAKHQAFRFKVEVDGALHPMSLDGRWLAKNPPRISSRDLQKIQKFVSLNSDVILQHWDDQISSKKFLLSLKPIS